MIRALTIHSKVNLVNLEKFRHEKSAFMNRISNRMGKEVKKLELLDIDKNWKVLNVFMRVKTPTERNRICCVTEP